MALEVVGLATDARIHQTAEHLHQRRHHTRAPRPTGNIKDQLLSAAVVADVLAEAGDGTISTQLRWSLPALTTWATADHDSLREIGTDDVTATLPNDPLGRYTMLQGLRSIFYILKSRKVVFVHPTRRVKNRQPEPSVPTAVDLAALRADLNSDAPATAAIAALLAFHAIPK